MVDSAGQGADDALIDELRRARDVPAVLKMKLAELRASAPDVLVFVFEGIDDKLVYFHWIKQIDSRVSYEPFVCRGKANVLGLKGALDRDLGDLKRNVYFFVDRDFDDLRGAQSSDTIFMTDRYSFENYLVTPDALDELLKNEFHCHAEVNCRSTVIAAFYTQYSGFLAISKELNRRIYIARKCQIPITEALPDRIGKIAEVRLTSVASAATAVDALVPMAREPSPEEIEQHSPAFEALDPQLRYRGKFALMFFRKWLALLAMDRNDAESVLFRGLEREGFVARGCPSLDSMAARAPLPAGLSNFISRISGAFVASPLVEI